MTAGGGGGAVPITVRSMTGAHRFVPQHSQQLEASFIHTPGLQVVAAEILAAEDVSVEVVSLRTWSAVDRTTVLIRAAKSGRVAVDDGSPTFSGPGAEIASFITEELFDQLAAPHLRLAAPDLPVAFARELKTKPTAGHGSRSSSKTDACERVAPARKRYAFRTQNTAGR